MPTLGERFAPGTIVAGRYRIEGELGQGGSGAVFRATQLNLDRPVALKAFIPEGFGDDRRARFAREASIVQRVEHPNIVRLLDFGIGAGAEPFLVFELLTGQTLEDAIRTGGPMSAARVAHISAQVLKALMEAHARGVVHRDVKPGNIFLCSFEGAPDFVKLLDFGIARAADDGAEAAKPGTLVGTPAYMAPEQATGAPVSFAADLFALGLTMEEALTGKPVFTSVSLVDMVREHLTNVVVPHAEIALGPPLGPVIHRATQKLPERRHPSAEEMLAHLEAAMGFASSGLPSSEPRADAAAQIQRSPESFGSLPTAAPWIPAPLEIEPPRVVSAPPVRRSASPRRLPWAAAAAVLCAVALGSTLALVLLGARRPERAPSSSSPLASGSSAIAPGAELTEVTGIGHNAPNRVTEAQVNADGVPDLVAECVHASGATPDLCAVDGATFTTLWRRRAPGEKLFLAFTAATVVAIDAAGIAHLLDVRTGIERGTVTLGGHVDWMCTPPDPGKVWLRTKQPRGVMLDVTARTVVDAPRPASCARGLGEIDCMDGAEPFLCPPRHRPVDATDVFLGWSVVEGGLGVARGKGKPRLDDEKVLGFEPLFFKGGYTPRTSHVLWEHPLVHPDELLASASYVPEYIASAGGRMVTGYELSTGVVRIVALDAQTGRTIWEVVTPPFYDFALSATRLYVSRMFNRVDVRDAATGRLLGGFGRELTGPLPRAVDHP